jgi:hypothetical protein
MLDRQNLFRTAARTDSSIPAEASGSCCRARLEEIVSPLIQAAHRPTCAHAQLGVQQREKASELYGCREGQGICRIPRSGDLGFHSAFVNIFRRR